MLSSGQVLCSYCKMGCYVVRAKCTVMLSRRKARCMNLINQPCGAIAAFFISMFTELFLSWLIISLVKSSGCFPHAEVKNLCRGEPYINSGDGPQVKKCVRVCCLLTLLNTSTRFHWPPRIALKFSAVHALKWKLPKRAKPCSNFLAEH